MNLTIGANVDYGWYDEAFSKSIATRSDADANWWGYAGYVAYDWTEKLRTAFRGEYFTDPMGPRTGAGQKTSPTSRQCSTTRGGARTLLLNACRDFEHEASRCWGGEQERWSAVR